MTTWFRSIVENRRRLFWTLQTLGWSGYALLHYLNGLSLGEPPIYIYSSLLQAVTGFLLTLGLRFILKRSWHLGFVPVLVVAVIATMVASAAFSVIQVWGHTLLLDPNWDPQGWEFLGLAFVDTFILLSWVGLYFGITYHRQLREQNERMLKITSMAHQAQLKMLRYQLNPHFLFNTLNAISTLVLSAETRLANEMLTRLSAFLRYTLINQPTHKVTLEKELEALNLYLDIEKVRFEDRLSIKMDIAPAARKALIPSLLMQPLVENALKYAIAPSEAGGELCFAANVEDGRLCLELTDTGPGLPAHKTLADPTKSSGVGIANTRERLRQFYGENFKFEMNNRNPSGLTVRIEIPVETKITDADRIAA